MIVFSDFHILLQSLICPHFRPGAAILYMTRCTLYRSRRTALPTSSALIRICSKCDRCSPFFEAILPNLERNLDQPSLVHAVDIHASSISSLRFAITISAASPSLVLLIQTSANSAGIPCNTASVFEVHFPNRLSPLFISASNLIRSSNACSLSSMLWESRFLIQLLLLKSLHCQEWLAWSRTSPFSIRT